MGFRGQNCSMDCPGIFLNSYSFLFFSVLRLECQWGLARINEECEYILARIALLIENCSISKYVYVCIYVLLDICISLYICIYVYYWIYVYVCIYKSNNTYIYIQYVCGYMYMYVYMDFVLLVWRELLY